MNSPETILLGSRLKWSNYSKYEDRLSTFQTWPKQMKQDKYAMATAGFFYLKEGDIVECFACGVRMSQWTITDIPAIEHQKCSPDCSYIKLSGSGYKSLDLEPSWPNTAFS